ncbi:MAG: phosphoribosylglycinamide formyltransferase [Verrucomicrobia bacterium]|nr:phosphoribosylglycinamide formyltransferase [Verrucomicrobiota bacterium]
MADEMAWSSSVEDARKLRDALDAAGKKLVFTNGCFDLLHAGHVRYLRQARALGDALLVALNSDASVRALKGPSRPVTSQEDRAEIMRALASVDCVVVFDEPRVTKLIKSIKPHIYAKGGDYTIDSLDSGERAALEKIGARIEILPLVPGRSTTSTLVRLMQSETTPVASIKYSAHEPEASTLRLAILGSGRGTNFDAVHRAIEQGTLDADIRVVISDVADAPILQKARELGYEAIHLEAGTAAKMSAASQKQLCDILRKHEVHVVVCAGFMRILTELVLDDFQDRIVNIHPSLLPKFKGRNAWVRAIEEGELESGCTVHLVTGEIDGGRILAQETVPIQLGDTPEQLYERIQEQEHKLLPRVLAEWRARGLPTE